jgi:acetamidase/formamidase
MGATAVVRFKVHKGLAGRRKFVAPVFSRETYFADPRFAAPERFLGVMGMPPDEPGRHPTTPPRACGGNIDCKELVAGSTLYLPIPVDGALFSAGDGHAVQGDGEVCLTALETCLRGTFEFAVHKGQRLEMPRAATPTHLIAMGLDPDLDDAAKQALREMIRWLVDLKGWKSEEAYVFCSLACDLRVTQLVDGNKGIHAMVERSLLA